MKQNQKFVSICNILKYINYTEKEYSENKGPLTDKMITPPPKKEKELEIRKTQKITERWKNARQETHKRHNLTLT